MRIKVHLTIGYSMADCDDILEIDDEDLEGMTEDEREEFLMKETEEWANNYIEYYYEEE
jgi:hypothetical protein